MVVTHGHLSQLWANMFLSMASLILLMKLRFLYQEIQRRMKRHRNYVMVNQTLQERCSLSLSLYRPRIYINIGTDATDDASIQREQTVLCYCIELIYRFCRINMAL